MDYEYRRLWVVQRERTLAGLFGIEIGFHAEMSNHLHVIPRTRPDVVETWSDDEVVRRWLTITKYTRHFEERPVQPEVRLALRRPDSVSEYRARLSDVSWFMACLTEYVARRANQEDNVTGRFCRPDIG